MKIFLKGQNRKILDRGKSQNDFLSALKFSIGIGIVGFVIYWICCYLIITHEALPALFMAGMFSLVSSVFAFRAIRTDNIHQNHPNSTESWTLSDDGFELNGGDQRILLTWDNIDRIVLFVPQGIGAINMRLYTNITLPNAKTFLTMKAQGGFEELEVLIDFAKNLNVQIEKHDGLIPNKTAGL